MINRFFIYMSMGLMMWVILVPGTTHAQRLDLSNFFIDTYEGRLVARFSVEVDDFERVRTALDNGTKVALVCNVDLLRSRVLLRDKSLLSKEIEVGLEKDLLSGEYVINFPAHRRSLPSFDHDDFTKLFHAMDAILLPIEDLDIGRKHVVRIEARLISKGVPKWIKRTLFFWSWDLASSIRYDMEFSL
ncbi:DUF4390 domain-containing protein [Desulfonatronovibrio hydrogenovorans]|uniref:DUF4390 domain-containing protein n=1 Tax=Desulfonatronovibrio hydrogenovorans TaxID=53245 RepID=UPI00048DC3A0|nr:DUF4390 domain-containing protein [Desulfonatronovibrio hydrogenovorans]